MPNPFDQFDAPAAGNPFDQFDQPAGPPSDITGGAAPGMFNTIIAGMQQTSPVVNGRYGQPLGEAVASDAPSGYGINIPGGPDFNPQTQVILRDPQSGKLMVYNRSDQTNEGVMSSMGHLAGLAMPAPTRLAGGSLAVDPAQRIAMAFTNTGVPPTLSTITPGFTSRMVQNGLRVVPGAGTLIDRAEQAGVDATAGAAGRTAASFGSPQAAPQIGEQIQSGIEAAVGRFQGKANELFQAVPIAGDSVASLDNTAAALSRLTSKFPSAPGLGKLLTPDLFQKLNASLQKAGTLTWDELKLLRTEVGSKIRVPVLLSDVPRADLERLYGALSEDMRTAAAAAGPDALAAFNKATQFYKDGMDHIRENLMAVFDAKSAESAFGQLLTAAGTGKTANAGKLAALKQSLTADEWGDVAASVIDQIGRQKPGVATGLPGHSTFSPGTFVTNLSSLSDDAKDVLFGTGDLRRGLDDLAIVAGAQKFVGQGRNFSNTAPAVGTAAVLGGMVSAPMSTLGSLAIGAASAKLLTNARFVKWLAIANKPTSTPQMIYARLQQMIAAAPPDIQAEVKSYAQRFRQSVMGPQQQQQAAPPPAPQGGLGSGNLFGSP